MTPPPKGCPSGNENTAFLAREDSTKKKNNNIMRSTISLYKIVVNFRAESIK